MVLVLLLVELGPRVRAVRAAAMFPATLAHYRVSVDRMGWLSGDIGSLGSELQHLRVPPHALLL